MLAGSTVTNTGATVVDGNLGVWPGTSVTGLPPGIVTGTTDAGNSAAMLAEADLSIAYNSAAAETCGAGNNLSGDDLGTLVLVPGVYCFSSSAQLTGKLTLDDQGAAGSVFVFQIGSTLTTAAASSVAFTHPANGDTVYWQVGSSATLGANTNFAGNILALTSITLITGADITDGRALAINGAVTLDTNVIDTAGTPTSASPEPGSASLLGMALLVALAGDRLRSRKRC